MANEVDDEQGQAAAFGADAWMQRLQESQQRADEQHARQMAEDPVYRGRYLATEAEQLEREKVKAEREEQARWRRARASLLTRGIPVKDVEAIVGGTLRETAALRVAKGWWSSTATVLVLSGTRGCGKTTAAAWCVAQEPPDDPYRSEEWYRAPEKTWRVWEPRFADVTVIQRASRYDEEQMLPLERAAVLAIDDLGMEYADVKGSFAALFDGLFNSRYAAQLKTVITTNLPAAEFKARYGERVADRIRECGTFVELNEQSLRGAK